MASQRWRRRIEEIFDWPKMVGLLRKTRHRGGATHWLDVNLRAGGGDDYVFLTRFFRSLLERLAPGTSLQTRRFPTPGGGYQSDGLVGLR